MSVFHHPQTDTTELQFLQNPAPVQFRKSTNPGKLTFPKLGFRKFPVLTEFVTRDFGENPEAGSGFFEKNAKFFFAEKKFAIFSKRGGGKNSRI